MVFTHDASPGHQAHTKPWRASLSSVARGSDRALKASPSGGLRPALTALEPLAGAEAVIGR